MSSISDVSEALHVAFEVEGNWREGKCRVKFGFASGTKSEAAFLLDLIGEIEYLALEGHTLCIREGWCWM